MDLLTIIGLIGSLSGIFGVLPAVAYFTEKLPSIKKILYKIFNKTYFAKINASKEYTLEKYNLKPIKMKIHEKYDINKINLPKKNSMIISIKNMQSPYKILFLRDLNDSTNIMKVNINLEGEVKFTYRNSDNNKEYLNIVDELFTIIEEEFKVTPEFKWYSLNIHTEKLKNKPFKDSFEIINCKDTKIEIDKTTKFMKINSDSINNLIYCLNSNIKKII